MKMLWEKLLQKQTIFLSWMLMRKQGTQSRRRRPAQILTRLKVSVSATLGIHGCVWETEAYALGHYLGNHEETKLNFWCSLVTFFLLEFVRLQGTKSHNSLVGSIFSVHW